MKKTTKALLLVLCAVMLVAGSVMGTLAYLTSQDEVTNTFTVGKVEITLDEAKVDEYGVADTTVDRVKENEYKLIPGHTYVKDPVVHVDAESENCFLYVKVENAIAAIEAETTIVAQLTDNGWNPVANGSNVYYYKDVCGAGFNIPIFTQFKIRDDVSDLSAYEGLTIVVNAYAVQHDGFTDAVAAWNATFGA